MDQPSCDQVSVVTAEPMPTVDDMAERYAKSELFVQDAYDWIANCEREAVPQFLHDALMLAYVDTPDFDTALDDLRHEDRSLGVTR